MRNDRGLVGLLSVGAMASLTVAAGAEAQVQFAEEAGVVVMEMESVPIGPEDEWSRETALEGATGGAYYQFRGNGICSGPANSPLRYGFRVTSGGTWRLHLRAARYWHCVMGEPNDRGRCGEHDRTCNSLGQPDGDSCGSPDQCIRTDISNDAFVHVEDADGNYVSFVGQPSGSIGDPIKLFGGGNDSWGWTGARALDRDGKHDADWMLEPGEYTLVVAGRSKDFRIDRMVFYHRDSASLDDGKEHAETLSTEPPPEVDAGTEPPPADDAGMMSVPVDGGVPTGGGPSEDDDAGADDDDGSGGTGGADPGGVPGGDGELEGGCSVAPNGSTGWLALAILLLFVRRRRS